MILTLAVLGVTITCCICYNWQQNTSTSNSTTPCNTLQHTATHCNTLQHCNTHCNTLQHIATHCNTLTSNSTETICSSALTMGWLRLVGSLKLQVSFAEYRFFYRALLQKRPINLRSLLQSILLCLAATNVRQHETFKRMFFYTVMWLYALLPQHAWMFHFLYHSQ